MPTAPPAGRPAHAPVVVFVDTPELVPSALDDVTDDVVGVDVERADADRYFRRAALVQVGVAQRCVLLDGVRLDAMEALDTLLDGSRIAVLHALENDLDPLARKGVVPSRVADTAVAAAILGMPTGLGPLLHEVLGIQLEGDKSAFQRADWEARPLSDDMAAYAAGDVVHLPALWSALGELLDAAGRRSWYDEELAHIVVQAGSDARCWTRVKGAGRLSPTQRAVLRSVWEEREHIARTHDVAPNLLVHEDVLRDLATTPPTTVAALVKRSNRRRSLLRQHAPALLDAITRGLEAPPEPRDPTGARRWSDGDRAVLDALRKRRAKVATALGMDPGVLCPSRALFAPAGSELDDRDQLCEVAGLRHWQAEILADELWDAYRDARSSRGTAATG